MFEAAARAAAEESLYMVRGGVKLKDYYAVGLASKTLSIWAPELEGGSCILIALPVRKSSS